MIATRARNVEASTVPEIIERRFGPVARNLAMVSLVVAYMVIVSYQFNAGGAVLEVIVGEQAACAGGRWRPFVTNSIDQAGVSATDANLT